MLPVIAVKTVWKPLKRSRPFHVAVLIETSRAYGRGLLLGVANYIRDYGPWIVYQQEQKYGDEIPGWLKAWRGDGILMHLKNSAEVKLIRRLRVPVVQFQDTSPEMEFPAVLTSNDTIGEMAFEHLRERGFRHFAYSGFSGTNCSDARRDAFVRQAEKHGLQCHIFQNAWEAGLDRKRGSGYYGLETVAAGYLASKNRQRAERWLRELPKPVGLMACNDVRGRQMLDVCLAAGVKVPDEIAVIGVDNDEVFCDLSNPPLSSVIPNAKRIGYEAAALLARMMGGEKISSRPIYVEPLGVATRRSTEVLAIEDRQIATAARFIRERACERIGVSHVARAAALSSRALQRRFVKILGHSPKEEILRVQLNRAKQLLAETDFPLSWIAEKIGLEHVEYISRIFKKKTGMTPGEFRTRSQTAIAADKLAGLKA